MDHDRWQRMSDIFQRAVELPPDAWEDVVNEACAGDGALRDEVMALLRADREPNSLLDGRAVDAIDAAESVLPPGSHVGSYRIIERVGSGGMGAVYLAERADGQFEQRVALKVIKRGMDSAAVLARFQAERQILARLQHANIARLTDGGMTADGLPFFTMEFVDGLPITRYCDEHHLSIEERLDLFQAVCAAVHYAHGNLVVHRDLKPGNILVTRDGQVKLLDFGIARVLGEDDAGLTRSGQRVMTPAYASPEQVRGEPITTASDVYSLGVILYELLCGRHPHRDTASTPAGLEHAITTTPAERPSRFVTHIDRAAPPSPTAAEIALARRLTPARLRKRLEGDLDNICLMALRKEPERRYSSPAQLLDDIRLHLSGRPVRARADSLRYRAGKFVRRNAAGVAAAATLVVVVTAITVTYTIRLERERDRARLEARKAAAASEFLSGLFKEADPYTSRGETITAREMLDRGRDRVHSELKNHPRVLADVLQTIGEAYGNLGVFDDAISSLRESLALRTRALGVDDATTVQTMESLMEYLNESGQYREADSLGSRAVVLARALGERKLLAATLGTHAVTQNYLGHYDQAEKLFRECIRTWQVIEGPDSKNASPEMNDLALMLHEQSRYAQADSLYRKALAIQEKEFGERHPETATTRYNYAQLLGDEGHLTDAREMWEKVLANDRALYPAGHPAIAYTLSAYGRLLSRIGEFARAEEFQREALEIRRKYYGDKHPDVAYSLASLGRVIHEQGRYDEAEALAREAYALHARLNGSAQRPLVGLKNEIGLIQYDRGDYAAADTSFANAIAMQRRLSGDAERHELAVGIIRHGAVLVATGHAADGETMTRDGVAMLERLHGDEGMAVATAHMKLGFILIDAGKPAEADTLFARSLAEMRALETGAPKRPRDIDPLLGLGMCRLAAGDAVGAEKRFRAALDIARRYLPAGHPDIARCETGLGEALLAERDVRGALPLCKNAVDALAKRVLPAQLDLVAARRALSRCTGGRAAGS